jgi:hypothetical protein
VVVKIPPDEGAAAKSKNGLRTSETMKANNRFIGAAKGSAA